MNARDRRKAIAAMFEMATDEELVNALEWVENDLPMFFGDYGVRYQIERDGVP